MTSALGNQRPHVTIIDPLDESIITIGQTVPINALIQDNDTPGYLFGAEFYWSHTGALDGNEVLLGVILPTTITGKLTSVENELAMRGLAGVVVGDSVSREDLGGIYYFCKALPSNDAANWKAVSGGTLATIMWNTASVTAGKPGAIFVRAYDETGFGHFSSVSVTLNNPPSAISNFVPTEGQRVNSGEPINMMWTAATDLDDPQSELCYLIEYSLNGGTSYNYAPGVPFTAKGVTNYTFDPAPYEIATSLRLRVTAFDGYSYGPAVSTGVSFKPVVTNITAPFGPVIPIGTIVPLDCTVVDQDTSLTNVYIEWFYSPTGLWANRLPIGTTAPGNTAISWNTTGYPSNKTGNAAIFARGVDEVGPGEPRALSGVIFDYPPNAVVVTSPTVGQRFDTNDTINFEWNPITDPDDPSVSIACRIEYSINGGATWNNAPGLAGGLTAPGATQHMFNMAPIPMGGPVMFRFTGWDGWLFGPSTTRTVTFRPVVLGIAPTDGNIHLVGSTITLTGVLEDRDTPTANLTMEYFYSHTGLWQDRISIGTTAPGVVNIDWDTTPIIPTRRVFFTLFAVATDEIGQGPVFKYGQLIKLEYPPDAVILIAPQDGQRFGTNDMIECRWKPITDADTPSANVQCHIEYSRDGGATWSNVPGLADGLTAPGAVTHTVDMSLIPLGGPFKLRFSGYDGSYSGPHTTIGLTFSPAVTAFVTDPVGMAHEGELVKLIATVKDRDSNPAVLQAQFWYSWSGLLADAKLVGLGTLGGPHEFDWTPTPLPNGYRGSRGNGRMYVRARDEVDWGPYSAFPFELNTFPRASNLNFTQKANTFRSYSITFVDDNDIITVARELSRPAHVPMDEVLNSSDYEVNAFFTVDADVAEVGTHTWQYRVDGDPRGPHFFTATLEILPADPEPSDLYGRFYVPIHYPGALR